MVLDFNLFFFFFFLPLLVHKDYYVVFCLAAHKPKMLGSTALRKTLRARGTRKDTCKHVKYCTKKTK